MRAMIAIEGSTIDHILQAIDKVRMEINANRKENIGYSEDYRYRYEVDISGDSETFCDWLNK